MSEYPRTSISRFTMRNATNMELTPIKCATCRFRGTEKQMYDDAGERRGVALYPCFAIEHTGRADTGEDGTIDVATVVDSFEKKAVVVDGSGYAAQLLVRDDFGCVLHEPKHASLLRGGSR